jgi:hypothetical protein
MGKIISAFRLVLCCASKLIVLPVTPKEELMSKLATVVCILVLSGLAAAQVPLSGNVFVGYSYYNSNLQVDRASLNGWEGSLEGKVFPFVGIVADFSEHYGSQDFPILCPVGVEPCGPGSLSTHELNVMFGPRVSFSAGRWRPFGQALFGVAHINTGGSTLSQLRSSIKSGVQLVG